MYHHTLFNLTTITMENLKAEITKKYNSAVAQLTHNKNQHIKHLDQLEIELPKIKEALKFWGVEVVSVNARKIGMDSNWTEENYLAVSIQNKVINNKIRFLTDRPYQYTSSGAGVNCKRLAIKAAKISYDLQAKTGLRFAVNHYSLESKDGKPRPIIIDVFIKL